MAALPTAFTVSLLCWFTLEVGLRVFALIGLTVIWAGLALRVWAVQALGGSFSTFVQAEAGQAVVTDGPYRWVRHPSSTGLLLIGLGFGIGGGNWLSLIVAPSFRYWGYCRGSPPRRPSSSWCSATAIAVTSTEPTALFPVCGNRWPCRSASPKQWTEYMFQYRT